MKNDQFLDVKVVIADPLKFKLKLAIGEEAYGSLRLKNRLEECWDNYEWAATGAAAAKSTLVASQFFAPQGFLAFIGVGTAVTPIGWVIAAAVLTGGAAIGVKRFLNDSAGNRVAVVPKFINTPIDVLAVSLFDLIAPLAFKVAEVDGQITDDERKWIKDFFVNEWGYDALFLDAGFQVIESNLDNFSIRDVAGQLAEFSKANQDCNYTVMTRELVGFFRAVMEADGKIDEREEFAVEKIEAVFSDVGRTFTQANLVKVGGTLVDSLKAGAGSVGSGMGALGQAAIKNSEKFVSSEAFNRAADTAAVAKLAAIKGAGNTVEAGKALIGKFLKKSEKR